MDGQNGLDGFKGLLRLPVSLAMACLLLAPAANGQDRIEFPQEELAAESVLPIFDQPVSVKNRNINTAKRLEIGAMGGQSLLEPFYNPMNFGLTATYHFTEEHGFNLFGTFFMPGLSENGKGLGSVPSTDGTVLDLKLENAPAPKFMLLGNYQFTGFYGKISISKEFIMNLHTYGLAGLGLVGVGDTARPGANVGIGQKFYLGQRFALRFDLRFMMYQGPNVLSKGLGSSTGEVPASEFDDKLALTSLLTVGAVYLLPSF